MECGTAWSVVLHGVWYCMECDTAWTLHNTEFGTEWTVAIYGMQHEKILFHFICVLPYMGLPNRLNRVH